MSAMSGALINVTPRSDPGDGVFDAVREPATFHLVNEQVLPVAKAREGGGLAAAILRPIVGAGRFLGASGVAFCVMIFTWIMALAMVLFLFIAGGYGVMSLITKVNGSGHALMFFLAAFGCFVAIGLATQLDRWVSRLCGVERG